MTTTTTARKTPKTKAIVPRSGPFGMGLQALHLAWRALVASEPVPVLYNWDEVDADLARNRSFGEKCVAEIAAHHAAAHANVWSGRQLPDGVTAAGVEAESPVVELDAVAEAHLAVFNAAHDAETGDKP